MKLLIAMLGLLLVSPALVANAAERGAASPAAAFELAQSDQGGDPAQPRDIDINVQVGEDSPAASGGAWWTEPIWIAVFIIGGIALLTLLVVASRGSGSPATVVKG